MNRNQIVFALLAILCLSLGLAWVSTGFESLQGWGSFLAVILLAGGILFAGWRGIRSDHNLLSEKGSASHSEQATLPAWLGWLLIGAVLLRLGAGVLWFVALPQVGYGGEGELAGYVMGDAFERDKAAWDLARSPWVLSAAFSEFRGDDQYGGILFGSALVYRYLGGETHLPLQIVVLTASFSALTVLFTWAFARRLWGVRIAGVAAWIVALFPDAVLLGSSQMREAFMMTLAIIAFYGLVRVWQDRSPRGAAWIILPLLFSIPLSPLFAVMLAGMLFFFAFFLGGSQWLKDWRVWAVLVGLLLLGLLVVTLLGDQILPGGNSNPIVLLQRWLRQAARWQAYNSEHASGWMQKIYRATPKWTHTWLLLAYGVARPFLPAALFDSSASIWQAIAIWRSLGWALLLPFLVAAPLIAWRKSGWRNPAMGLSILVWAGILLASFRGGGDGWDNPRYRTTWIGIQSALAAWVWVVQKRDQSPWLRRLFVALGLIFLWFVPWYLTRLTMIQWPVQDVFLTLGLGILSAAVYWVFDILRLRKREMGD